MIRQSSARKAININKATSSKQKKQHASQWKAKQNKARQNKAKPNKHCFKKPSIPKLRKTKNVSGWISKGQKTINKNNKKKKKKKKRKKKVVFRGAWASHMMGAWASHDNLSEKELQVVAVTNKNIAAEKEWEGKENEAQASDTYETVENELLLLLYPCLDKSAISCEQLISSCEQLQRILSGSRHASNILFKWDEKNWVHTNTNRDGQWTSLPL